MSVCGVFVLDVVNTMVTLGETGCVNLNRLKVLFD